MAIPVKTQIGGGAHDRAILNQFYSFPATGNVYYVHHDGSSTGPGLSPAAAFSTLDAAIGACTANNGDVIVVLEGHAESLGAAGAVTCDVAGVRIIGMGHGANRPTFTWSVVGATWVISAANVSVENIRCTCSVDEVVKLFSVSGVSAKLNKVDFFETGSAQAIQFLLTTAAADDLEICNCRHVQVTAAAADQIWIGLTGADRAYIHDNTFILTLKDAAAGAVIGVITTACVNVEIARNNIRLMGYSANLLSAFLSLNTTTGIVADNRIGANVAANTTINDMPGCHSFNNLCTNAVDTSGIVDPVVDT